jgi:hypothetical protein
MHGCAVQFIGFFLKLENDRYKLEASTIFLLNFDIGRKSLGKKIEAPKGPYLLDNLAESEDACTENLR